MEGLVSEPIKHTTEEVDALVIAQYQRMTHYGIAGFGTAMAFAEAMGLKEDQASLKIAVKGIYGADKFMSKLAETSLNLKAQAAKG